MLLIALSLAEICSSYPTMGGLYFWVCKMKPDLPFLGCEYYRCHDTMLMKKTHASLHGLGLFYRDGVYRDFWQLKVIFLITEQ